MKKELKLKSKIKLMRSFDSYLKNLFFNIKEPKKSE